MQPKKVQHDWSKSCCEDLRHYNKEPFGIFPSSLAFPEVPICGMFVVHLEECPKQTCIMLAMGRVSGEITHCTTIN